MAAAGNAAMEATRGKIETERQFGTSFVMAGSCQFAAGVELFSTWSGDNAFECGCYAPQLWWY